MSYAEIKPQYYQMHQPDSPWHAGARGWKDAPFPSFGNNPNLVGPPRLAVEGLGAYFQPAYENPINGMGAYFQPAYEKPISGVGACPCSAGGSAKGVGTFSLAALTTPEKLGIGVAAGVVLYLVYKAAS